MTGGNTTQPGNTTAETNETASPAETGGGEGRGIPNLAMPVLVASMAGLVALLRHRRT